MSDCQICPICHEDFKDEIYACCDYLHAYCFKCILNYVKTNNKLTPCVLCRDSCCLYIHVPENRQIIKKTESSSTSSTETEDIETLKYFLKSLHLIRKINGTKYKYSSLITENELKCFIKNKDNITLYHKIIESNLGTHETIFPSIKWESNTVIRSDPEQIINMLSNISNNPNQGVIDLFTLAFSDPGSLRTSTGNSTGNSTGTSTGTTTTNLLPTGLPGARSWGFF